MKLNQPAMKIGTPIFRAGKPPSPILLAPSSAAISARDRRPTPNEARSQGVVNAASTGNDHGIFQPLKLRVVSETSGPMLNGSLV